MKQAQQPAPSHGAPARSVPAAQRVEQPRPLRSTAAILAQGVTLTQVQQAVRRLRPHIQEHT